MPAALTSGTCVRRLRPAARAGRTADLRDGGACRNCRYRGPAASNPPETSGYALAASVLVEIGRAWERVGDIDTGLTASLTVLTGHRLAQQQLADPAARDRQAENSHDGQVERMPQQAGTDEAEGEAT
jgi:hypothetical protein